MTRFEYSARNPQAPLAFASLEAMNTILEMVLVGVDEAQGRRTVQAAEGIVAELGRRLNRFDPGSVIARINRREQQAPDPETCDLLGMCLAFRDATEGYFDVTARARGPYGIDPAGTIRFERPDTQIDLGGVAKGYALERVKQLLAEEQIGRALVNFGNSSVLALGAHPFGAWWEVGVEHPGAAGKAACTLRLCDEALSVSGRTPAGAYHIVDPATGELVRREEMIVVTGRSTLVAEVLSTALYAAPRERQVEIMKNFEGYRAVALDCRPDGTVANGL